MTAEEQRTAEKHFKDSLCYMLERFEKITHQQINEVYISTRHIKAESGEIIARSINIDVEYNF